VQDGQLLVSPVSKLTQGERDRIKAARDDLLAIIAHEDARPPATDADLRAWFNTLESEPKKNILCVGFTEANEEVWR